MSEKVPKPARKINVVDLAGQQVPTNLTRHLIAAESGPIPNSGNGPNGSDDPVETFEDYDQAEAHAKSQRVIVLDGAAYDEIVRLCQHGISARIMAWSRGELPREAIRSDLTHRAMQLLHSQGAQ